MVLSGLHKNTGLHKLYFFVHKISCTQKHFRRTPVHMEHCARKRADVHVINNDMIQY